MLASTAKVSLSAIRSATCRRSVGSLRPFISKSSQVLSFYFSSPESTRTSRRTQPFASSVVDEVPSSPTSSEISPAADVGTGDSFPVLKLRGIPFEVEEDGIKEFLGCQPIDILFVRRSGRRSGEVFVVFASAADLEQGLSKNMSHLGERYIEVMTAKKTDYYRAISFEVKQGLSGLGSRLSPERALRSKLLNPADSNLGAGETCVLKLRGLPFSATEGEIGEWLADSSLGIPHVTSDKILIAFTGKRPSGVAFVEFDSPAEASAALQGKSNQIMGGRYIEIFPSDPVEMSKYQ